MADLSSFSEDELRKMLSETSGTSGITPPPPSPTSNLTSLSDAELVSLLEQESGKSNKDLVVQEQHPDLTFKDRFVVKNLATGNEAAVNYLQKRHPNLEIKVDDKSGQILARKRDGSEPVYRTLDPSGFDLQDLTDITADAAAGVGTTLATAGAGALGAAAGGAGAIPAAVAGGAASSAGLEALRQKLGSVVGLDQELDPTQIGAAGVVGAASPLLFGTGVAAGKVAEGPLKKLATEGAFGYAKDAAKGTAKGAAGFFSGAGKEAVDTYTKHQPVVETLRNSPEGVINFLDDTGKMVDEKFATKLNEKWGEVKSALGSAGDQPIISTDKVKDQFKEALTKAEKMASRGTEASKELLEELRSAFDRHFMVPDTVSTTRTVMKPSGLLDASGNPILTEGVEQATQTVKKEVANITPDQALDLSRELADIAGYRKAPPLALTGGGQYKPSTSQVDKELMSLGSRLHKTLNQELDAALPVKSGPLKKEWAELKNLETEVKKLVQSPRQAFANLRNADITSNMTNKQLFHKIDRLVGTDLGERAKIASAAEIFGKGRASWFSPVTKRFPAAAIGGAAGYGLGLASGQPGISPATALAGGAAGAALGGPAAMRNYIRAVLATQRATSKLPTPQGTQQALGNIWLQMQGDKRGNN